jgi:hypothetical protein
MIFWLSYWLFASLVYASRSKLPEMRKARTVLSVFFIHGLAHLGVLMELSSEVTVALAMDDYCPKQVQI